MRKTDTSLWEVSVLYSYHNTIKKRIKNGELTGFSFVDDYKDIGECLLLYFSTPPFIRPVRPHRYAEYITLIDDYFRKQL